MDSKEYKKMALALLIISGLTLILTNVFFLWQMFGLKLAAIQSIDSFMGSALSFTVTSFAYCAYMAVRMAVDRNYLSKTMTVIEKVGSKKGLIILTSAVLLIVIPYAVYPLITGKLSYTTYNTIWVGISFFGSIFLYFQWTHILSIITVAILLVYLWHRWSNLTGAIIIAFVSLACGELFNVPVHLLKWGNILPYFAYWYIPNLIMLYPFLLSRKYFSFGKKFWVLFLAAFACEFLVFLPGIQWTSVWSYDLHTFVLNPEYLGKPFTLGMWAFELTGRVRRTVQAIAFSQAIKR